MMVKFDVAFAIFLKVRKCGDIPCKLGVCKMPQLDYSLLGDMLLIDVNEELLVPRRLEY